jgi:exodeoxyribonuclease VII large subunit
VLERRIESLFHQRGRLVRVLEERLGRDELRLRRLREMLRTLGPESAFQRGFSLTLGPDGRALRSAAGVAPGTRLRTKFADGELSSEVVEPEEKH